MPKQIIPINDESVVHLNTNAFDMAEGFDDRSVLASHLGRSFFIQAMATEVTKIVGFQKLRMFKSCTAVLLTTTGRLECVIKVKSFQFSHLWLADNSGKVGELYTALLPAVEYLRIDGSLGYGFSKTNLDNPAELFEVNFRLVLGLLNIQLLLQRTDIRFRFDDAELHTYLSASMEALQTSDSLLTSMYQSKKLEECSATRGIISLLNLWLDVLKLPKTKTKIKTKAKKGFALV